MRTALFPALVAALLAVSACSDFATEPTRFPAALELAPDTLVVRAGDSTRLELTVLDQRGEAYPSVPSWSAPTWGSTASQLLTVTDEGVVRGVAPGEAHATAAVAGLGTSAVVRVNPRSLDVDIPFVHITQGVQRRAGDIPLVAGRAGLLRVLVRAGGVNYFRPTVRATFRRAGAVVHTETPTLEAPGLPQRVEEGDLELSYDALIPGSVLQPGTGVVVEVDPDGVLPSTGGSMLRHPQTGEWALDVRGVPPFRLRLVPVDVAGGPGSSWSASNGPEQIQLAEDVFPLGEVDVDVREPAYSTSVSLATSQGWVDLLQEITALRLDDGSPRYYFGGVVRPSISNILGVGWVGYPVAIGDETQPETIAHELGHNLNLLHAPCGNPDLVDPDYPYFGAGTGEIGYDRTNAAIRDPASTVDLMSYCRPVWISDYNYEKVLAHRDTSAFDAVFAESREAPGQKASRTEVRSLIIQGGVYGGALRLEPAIPSRGPAVLPSRPGAYTLEGLDGDGATLFRLSVTPRRLDHPDGALFAVAVPVELARPGRLARLRLTGPEGTVERVRGAGPAGTEPRMALALDAAGQREARWDTTAYPMAVVRDAETGRIVAMSRTGRVPLPADPAALEVAVSDGVAMHPLELRPR